MKQFIAQTLLVIMGSESRSEPIVECFQIREFVTIDCGPLLISGFGNFSIDTVIQLVLTSFSF